MLVIQSASYNTSRLATVVVAVITSNTALAAVPGNVFLPAALTGLLKDSVVNVTALVSGRSSRCSTARPDAADRTQTRRRSNVKRSRIESRAS